MVKISSHVAYECCIYDLTASVVLGETEHVASKVFELFLSDIRHGLAYNLSDILSHNGILFCVFVDEKSKSIDFRGSNVDIVGGLFDDKILFLFTKVHW